MDKKQLLELDAQSHLTPDELGKAGTPLGQEVNRRLVKRVGDAAIATLVRGSEKLQKLADDQGLTLADGGGRRRLGAAALKTLRDAVAADPALAGDPEVTRHLAGLVAPDGDRTRRPERHDPTLERAARSDEPVALNPEFSADLEAARIFKLADAAKLGDATARVVIDRIGALAAVTEDSLASLVKDGALTADKAAAVGQAASLHAILDERTELVAAAGKDLKDISELAMLDAGQWEKLIVSSKIAIPGELPAADYAGLVQAKVALLFPAQAIAAGSARFDVGNALAAEAALAPVRAANPGVAVVGAASLEGLDLSGLSAQDRKQAKAAHAEAARLSSSFPGMKVAAVLDSEALSAAERKQEVERRTGLATRFMAESKGLLGLDLTVGSPALKEVQFPAGTNAADQAMLLAHARTFQRTLSVTDDVAGAEALVRGGFHSALSIASSTIADLAKRAGLDPARAEFYYRRAKDIAVGVTGHFGSLIDTIKVKPGTLPVGNTTPPVDGFLKEIPGFAEFFGNQDYCNCNHCQSILSPAAYFVDLMCFIDEQVTQPYFAGQPNHVLNLKTRRPDLWSLELTCDNTNQPIPYLVIVNEILENAVAKDSGFGGNLADRSAVANWVYRDKLPDAVDSFEQPLNLPFEEIRTYLQHFQLTPGALGEAGLVAGDALARLRLALSPKDHDLIVTVRDGIAFLRKLYGINFAEAGGKITAFDAGLLVKPMGINRGELDDLIKTRFVTFDGTVPIAIVGAKRSAESIQNDIETIRELTRPALDRLHRFVRLRKATGWRTGELDIVLSHLAARGIGSGIDAASLRAIGQLKGLQGKLKLPVEELTALWSALPQAAVLRGVPLGSGAGFPKLKSAEARLAVSLFDRQFNQARYVAGTGAYPQDATLFLHPALADAPPAQPDPHFARLLAGTGTNEGELLDLVRGLGHALGCDPDAAAEAGRKFRLSLRNLTLLYRHARLARTLKLPVADLLALCALLPDNGFALIDGIDDLSMLVRNRDWLKASGRKLGELVSATEPAVPPYVASLAAVAGTAAGQTITVRLHGAAGQLVDEAITFAANADLAATLADWNGKAQHAAAYRADAAGMPDPRGTFLALRGLARLGARLEVIADSAGVFTAAVPRIATARALATGLVAAPNPAPAEIAAGLVAQCTDSGLLAFADTVFTFFTPYAPRIVGDAAAALAAAGETVVLTAAIGGAVQPEETIVLGAAASLDAFVADWNGKSAATLAYRADPQGNADPAGATIAITTRSGTGSATRITITQDSGAVFAPAAAASGGEITAAQSRALIAANLAALEPIPADGRYRLKAGFDPAAVLVLAAGIPPAYEPTLRGILKAYHGEAVLLSLLPGRIGCDAAVLPGLAAMAGIALSSPDLFGELRGDSAGQPLLGQFVARLQRLDRALASASRLGPDNLAFIAAHPQAFGISGFKRLGLPQLRRIDGFKSLVADWKSDPVGTAQVRDLLASFVAGSAFTAGDQSILADLLGCDIGTAQALQAALPLSAISLDAFAQLREAAALLTTIGAPAATFALVASSNLGDLAAASAAIQAGIRARYDDEADWEAKIEPYNNMLLSRRRDGLVAYLVHTGAPQFDEVNDLYHYYLLDVQVEGCMRTSRVAAAIDSAQLYINRCQMNLEETPPGAANPVHVMPASIPADQWDWRRNYRVWEASRKIFLYPENYIEPELRDDKTPEFLVLEEELLSKDITDEAVLDAFGKYLRAFDELAHLTIAGSFHEKDKDQRHDVLHLIGVSSDDPPTYYYRRVEDAHYGAVATDRATHWGAWEKLNVQIPVRKASPVVHRGQLYLFWIRYVTKPQNSVKDGASRFTGYHHKAYVEFTKRKVDGQWTTPQKLRLNEHPFKPDSFPESYQDDGVVLDPIVPKDVTKIELFQWFDLTLYSNFEPLYDDSVHEVPKEDYEPRGFEWDQLYPASGKDLTLRGVNFQMWSPVDLYRLQIGEQIAPIDAAEEQGVPWVNPVGYLLLLLFDPDFDLGALLPPRIVWSKLAGGNRDLHTAPSLLPCFDTYSYATLLLDQARVAHFEEQLAAVNADGSGGSGAWTRPQWDKMITDYLRSVQKEDKIAAIPSSATIDVVNGSVGDVIIQTSRDAFYLQAGVRADGKYHLRRLNTSLSEPIADILFHDGLETLLSTANQLSLGEAATGLTLVAGKVHDAAGTGKIDYNGAMGAYLREVFFHIPYLIADNLNSQGRHEDAQKWYHFIFDPTSAEVIQGLPAGLSAEERRRRELDRNWRYREFRGLSFESMRAQLTNGTAIEQYRRDPFNPHAIARYRLSAYQKSIVLKYADNLLDWGDDLFVKAFAQSNPEYLRDATLKYVIAQEILGGRPTELGDCGDGPPQPRTFATIKPHLDADSEFLMEFESIIVSGGGRYLAGANVQTLIPVATSQASTATIASYQSAPKHKAKAAHRNPERRKKMPGRKELNAVPADVRAKATKMTAADVLILQGKAELATRGVTLSHYAEKFYRPDRIWLPDWGRAVLRQSNPIFCVPGNDRIQSYWSRVEDRLFKLRHCQDINGVFRLLPLFAPAIDPALLVGGAASGLSLEDILGAADGSVPPYRFRYLVDKARSYAAAVQGFGGALLSALEKRDGEELVKLRNLHQKNLLSLTGEMKSNELKIAEQGIEIVRRRMAGAEYRRGYYESQISEGLLPAEIAQQVSQHISAGLRGGAMAVGIAAAIAKLVPQVGSPFAMKYGGLEVGGSLGGWLTVASNAATITDAIATSMGIIANNERRLQGWEHQLELAELDLKVIEKDAEVAELRRAIAQRSLDIHEKSRDQHDEVMEFYNARFTNLALYSHLARELQQLHREAYSNALAMARLAEQAYRFERPEDLSFFVGGEWDSSRAGLLAGERLSMALNAMDRRFVETNIRQAEINQTFSIAQIAPEALIRLKQSGSCEFAVPELYFDMFYPGQYRRRIKAVRLTIPCITGPYTNISAKLTLLGSQIRKETMLGSDHLVEVPFSGTPSITASTGQGDAGVFELNFRDERYMPFEGAGAVSGWRLELPAAFRPFDYRSINDVLINISYTADEDGALRQQVEERNGAIEGSLASTLASTPGTRIISLRQEFSGAFNRLLEAPAGTPVTIEIGERHFPLLLQGKTLQLAGASLVLDLRQRDAVGAFAIKLNGDTADGFPAPTDPAMPGDAFGGLPVADVGGAFAAGITASHTLTIEDPGDLAADPASGATLDPDKLEDILLVLEYTL